MEPIPARSGLETSPSATPELELDRETVALILARLPELAARTVSAITADVPAYRNALAGPLGVSITSAVAVTLRGFLLLVVDPAPESARGRRAANPALAGAYDLGRGEARGGRTMDALLTAYRVGAREAWREFAQTALDTGVTASGIARFAELVFAYIDSLSAASAAGHADELATTGRVRERYLARVAIGVLNGEAPDRLVEGAERAGWHPPTTFSAVLLPSEEAARAVADLDGHPLRVDDELPDLRDDEQAELSVVLVPDAVDRRRPAVLRSLANRSAYVGPAEPWTRARSSYLRALRARRLALPLTAGVCDTDDHLPALVVAADLDALSDLRRRVLAPLAGLTPTTAARLTETLRAWLLHQGRRDDIAAALHIHPQTVRYRLAQLREHFGDQLKQPTGVAALMIALLITPGVPPGEGDPPAAS